MDWLTDPQVWIALVTLTSLEIVLVLVADGFDQHIPRGYIYFAMGFSVLVEALNLRSDKKRAA